MGGEGDARAAEDQLRRTAIQSGMVTLRESGLEKIRAQLRAIYSAMERRGIQPGGPSALRLFS